MDMCKGYVRGGRYPQLPHADHPDLISRGIAKMYTCCFNKGLGVTLEFTPSAQRRESDKQAIVENDDLFSPMKHVCDSDFMSEEVKWRI